MSLSIGGKITTNEILDKTVLKKISGKKTESMFSKNGTLTKTTLDKTLPVAIDETPRKRADSFTSRLVLRNTGPVTASNFEPFSPVVVKAKPGGY